MKFLNAALNDLLCNALMNSLYTFLISASTDSFKLIIFFFLVLWLAEIGFTIFCVIWMKNHYAVCAISTGNKNMILGKGTMILGWQPIETIEITIVWISWMSLNFVRFHEILFQTDAEINSLLSWKKEVLSLKKYNLSCSL